MRRRQRFTTARSLGDSPAAASASILWASGMRRATSVLPFAESVTATSRLLLVERVRVSKPIRTRRVTIRDKVDASMTTIVGQIVCTDAGRWPVQREFYRRMKRRFDELGIEIARPGQTTIILNGLAMQPANEPIAAAGAPLRSR